MDAAEPVAPSLAGALVRQTSRAGRGLQQGHQRLQEVRGLEHEPGALEQAKTAIL